MSEVAAVSSALLLTWSLSLLGTYMPTGFNSVTNTTDGTPGGYQNDCLPCLAGHFCLNATIVPEPCGKGFFTKPGQSVCKVCLKGRYCDDNATTESNMNATKKCPGGQFCKGGLKDVSEATDCQTGHYCPEGSEVEIPCPVGTFNPNVNLTSVYECQMCTAGKYCREKSVHETGDCSQGFYCPTNFTDGVSSLRIGSYGPKQIPCPKATYQNESGGRFVQDCKACPISYYCPEGSVDPVICPLGHYCPPDSGDPQPCPIGTFNNQSGLQYLENCTACTPGW